MQPNKLFVSLTILILALLLGACGSAAAATTIASQANIPQITITATDYAFEGPAQIEGGLVSINLVNKGKEPHHAQLAQLNDGVTMEQFQAALQQSPEAALPLVSLTGGPSVVDSGESQEVVVDLAPGHYVWLCFVPDHEGVPHLAHGMIATMEVVENTKQTAAPEIKADATVKLLDFFFIMPAEVKAGHQVWKVVNEGQQPHEITIIKLAEGKTMEDVTAFIQSPHGAPPFTDAGGFQGISSGQSGWLNLNLQPGNYVALCHIPDPASGHAHTELGMVMPFSVK